LCLCCCVVPGGLKDCSAFVFRVKLGTEVDGTVVLRNVSNYLTHGTVSRPKTLESSTCLLPAYQHVTWKMNWVSIKFFILLKCIDLLQFWLESESNEGQLNVEMICICRQLACS